MRCSLTNNVSTKTICQQCRDQITPNKKMAVPYHACPSVTKSTNEHSSSSTKGNRRHHPVCSSYWTEESEKKFQGLPDFLQSQREMRRYCADKWITWNAYRSTRPLNPTPPDEQTHKKEKKRLEMDENPAETEKIGFRTVFHTGSASTTVDLFGLRIADVESHHS